MRTLPIATNSFFRCRSRRGFTLFELLTVIVIILTLSALSIGAIQGISKATGYDGSLSDIVGILEQARSYAVAQNTYVWVAFYPLDPSQLSGSARDNSGDQLYVAVFASSQGNNPFSWTDKTSYSIPYTDTVTGTLVYQVSKIQLFKQIRIWPKGGAGGAGYFTLATAPSSTASPTPVLSVQAPGPGQVTLPDAQTTPACGLTSAVVAFSPSGSALAGQALSATIGIDFQPMKSSGIANSANLATIRINGLTGLTSLYRQ